MKLILTEHTDILPGIRKRKGTTVSGLPKERRIQLVSEGKAEPLDYKGLPDGYPRRDLLIANEYYSIDQVEAETDDALRSIDGIGPKRLKEIRDFNPKNKEQDNG